MDWLQPEDRVLVLGLSKLESGLEGTDKDLNKVFDRKLYVPLPNYAHRLMIWKATLRRVLKDRVPDELDVSMLAHISSGFPARAIVRAVERTLTARRVDRLDRRLLSAAEFISTLSQSAPTRMFQDTFQKFRDFTADIKGPRFKNADTLGFLQTDPDGLAAERKSKWAKDHGDEGGGDKKKGKGGGKKKKK